MTLTQSVDLMYDPEDLEWQAHLEAMYRNTLADNLAASD